MQSKVPVVIVGGGPVGLSMGILLQRFGIDFVLLERSPSTTTHPKARGTYTRTMEIFRQWGIDGLMKRHALPDGADFFSFCESMTGHEWGRTTPEPNVGHSPCWKIIQSQDTVETELLDHARKSEVGRILFGHEFLHYDEGGSGIAVTSRRLDNGETTTWHVQYLIAADGAASSVRRQADIEMRGPATLAVMANEYWQADLSRIPRVTQTAGYRVRPEDPRDAIWTVLNGASDRWLSAGFVGVGVGVGVGVLPPPPQLGLASSGPASAEFAKCASALMSPVSASGASSAARRSALPNVRLMIARWAPASLRCATTARADPPAPSSTTRALFGELPKAEAKAAAKPEISVL